MHSFFVERKILHCLVAVFVFLYTTNVYAFAGDDDEENEDNPVSNVRINKQGKINIFIEYDLAGSGDEMYSVALAVRVKSDSTFSYTPINVIGDIGANIRPGKNKRISWRISDEYIPALDKDDVQFAIVATAPQVEGGNTGLYVAGGAAVVGLALAIVLLSSNKTGQDQQTNAFPLPYGRPR